MWSRRAFLGLGGAVGTAVASRSFAGFASLEAAGAAVADRTPEDVAQDEFYWRGIQEAVTPHPTLLNPNNSKTRPNPPVLLETTKSYNGTSNKPTVRFP